MPLIICTTLLVETSPQALPMGAACIASAIKGNRKIADCHEVKLVSFSREDSFIKSGNAAEKLAEKLLSFHDLKCICFSVYVWNRKILEKTCGIIKQKNPEIICVAGGPEVTANPFTLRNFDFLCAGEGELSMPELLQKLLVEKASAAENEADGFAFGVQGMYCQKNPGLYIHEEGLSAGDENAASVSKDSNEISIETGKSSVIPVIRSKTPDPATLSSPWLDGTINPSDYGGVLWELARGCPFKCSYCYESKGEKKIQYFPMERLEKELELFASKKIPQAFVLDPTYNASKKRALEMLKIIKQKAPEMFFYFEARAEFIDRELARAFASVNCSLQFGLQSADPEVLKKVNRTLDKNLFRKNINFLNEEGVVFGFDLIFGLPGDTLSGFKSSIDWALALYPNNLELFCLSVLPGTTLYEQAESLGLKWEAAAPYHVIESTTFPKAEIKKAAELSLSCDFFYNRGRAVPWFNSVLNAMKMKSSNFFSEFYRYSQQQKISLEECDFNQIMKVQKDFIASLLKSKHMDKLCFIAEDLISMNGAISSLTAEGKKSTVKLHYHPDDVMSEYAMDLQFFARNARQMPCSVSVFNTSKGPDWKIGK